MRGMRNKIKAIFRVDDDPKHIAISYAIGFFVGMSPLIGLHTVIGILLIWAFKLNRIVTLTGIFITNPASLVPIYTFSTWIGALLLGVDLKLVSAVNWKRITLGQIVSELGELVMPFVVGSLLVSGVCAVASYFIILKLLKKKQTSVEEGQ